MKIAVSERRQTEKKCRKKSKSKKVKSEEKEVKQEEHCWTEPDNLILQACPSEPENHPCTDFPSTQFETNKTFGTMNKQN